MKKIVLSLAAFLIAAPAMAYLQVTPVGRVTETCQHHNDTLPDFLTAAGIDNAYCCGSPVGVSATDCLRDSLGTLSAMCRLLRPARDQADKAMACVSNSPSGQLLCDDTEPIGSIPSDAQLRDSIAKVVKSIQSAQSDITNVLTQEILSACQ